MSALGQKRTYAVKKGHVRFTPNSDQQSGPPHKVMSASPPKADVGGANTDVRYGPIADIASLIRFPPSAPSRTEISTQVQAVRNPMAPMSIKLIAHK
jgi:hypothetical protein